MFRALRIPRFESLASCLAGGPLRLLLLCSLLLLPASLSAQSDASYYPGRAGAWDSRRPEEVGMNAVTLQAAVDLALANEFRGPRDLEAAILSSFEPDNTVVGPTKERGGPAGAVVPHRRLGAGPLTAASARAARRRSRKEFPPPTAPGRPPRAEAASSPDPYS